MGFVSYWLILAVLVGLTIKRPAYAYVAFLCLFGLKQWGTVYVPLLRQVSYLSNILILIPIWITCALRFDNTLVQGRGASASQRSWVVVLYLFAAVSLMWTPEDVDGQSKWLAALPYALTGVLVLPLCMRSSRDFWQAQRMFVYAGGLLMLLLAFAATWGLRALVIEGSHDQINLPLALGELAGYVLITASMYLRRSPLSWVLFGLSVVGSITVAIKSGSRGPLIFSILSIFIVMPMVWRGGIAKRYIGLAFLGAIFALGVVTAFTSFGGVYSDRWQAQRMVADSDSRFGAAMIMLEHSFSSPISVLFGLGNSAAFSKSLLGVYPHMVPLEVLAEEGLIGFGMWLFIMGVAAFQLRLAKSPIFHDLEAKRVFLTLFACFLFSVGLSCKQGSLISYSMPFVFVALQERYIALRRCNR